MKNAKIRFEQGLLFAAVLTCLGAAGVAMAQVAGNTEYCEITLAGCPPEYDQKELVVPLQVIALSTHVQACGIQDSSSNLGTPPAVMFIIDHSTSMGGTTGNDANGNRFRVTEALIDSIYATYPNAEVGMVVFANGLVFKAERDANLVDFTGLVDDSGGTKKSQAFLPLMQLNQPAKTGGTDPFYTGTNPAPNAIDVFRSMITVTGQRGSIPNKPEENGTDITIAFEAALQAFKETKKPPKNQYIIFLSDGEPIQPSGNGYAVNPSQRCNVSNAGVPSAQTGPNVVNNPRCIHLLDFEQGVLNGQKFPTTYTIYLQSAANAAVPTSIATMTANVKANGYSETNERSSARAFQSNFNTLLAYMMDEIVTPMLERSSGHPNNIVISSTGRADSTGSIADGEFIFSRQLPLDTSEVTAVNMRLRYDVQVNTTTQSGMDTSYIIKDSLFTYDFKIRRTGNPPSNWEASQKLRSNCKASPTLDLRFGGASLIGREVKGNMDVLQIVFDNTGGLFNYGNGVIVQVLNADGGVSDTENFTLAKNTTDGKYYFQFPRVVSETAANGDGKLQHAAQDSIILVFRNPDVPLDTIRVAVPYVSNAMAFYDTPGDPAGGKLLPDPDTVKAGDSHDIYAKLFKPDGSWDPDMTNSGKIKWTVTGTPAATLTEDGAHCVFRTETAGGTYTVTATYTDGPLTIKKDITIKVVPGDPQYIEVVTDSAKINLGRVADTVYLKSQKKFEFANGVSNAIFYAVLRDAYGNYIGMAVSSSWTVTPTTGVNFITAVGRGDFSSADVTDVARRGASFPDDIFVIVEKNGISDMVHVTKVGEPAAAVGPNPFVPGNSNIMEHLRGLGSTEKLAIYETIVANSKSGGGNGSSNHVNGVLVTATAPRQVETTGSVGDIKYTKAIAVIYDAVGHIVFKSKPGDIIMADGNTFGFVWNGKNMAGRTVGAGTYAMRMNVWMTNGEKFTVPQRMIGVTLDR